MPYFRYTARDADGKKKVSIEEARDKESLIERLQTQGLFVINVIPEIGAKPQKATGKQVFKRGRIKLEDLVLFARQLATMLNAGVPLLKSLEVISSQVESQKFSKTLEKVKNDLEKGSSLSQSLARHPKVFNQFWVSLAEVGEASGTLPVVLERLAFYLEQKADFDRTVLSAMLYPLILVCLCAAALLAFSLLIIPKFTTIFSGFNMKMPPLTAAILGGFGFIRTKFIFIVGGLFVSFVLFKRYISTPVGRRQWEVILLKLPIVGNFFRDLYIERFTSHMSILVESGVPLLYALEISERMIDNFTVAAIINKIKDNVRQGKVIAEPMQETAFFPPMVIQMITIGEETGELGNMLKRIAAFYQSIIETFLKRFGIIFEPVMLIFMGVVIGT
ncbi:MAG: type II secretion system F family protein, partial [Candidatus Omnitrophica bacterium]|nr:type II secretion system F family protein [Candidatus Omnitrophota bacterium]